MPYANECAWTIPERPNKDTCLLVEVKVEALASSFLWNETQFRFVWESDSQANSNRWGVPKAHMKTLIIKFTQCGIWSLLYGIQVFFSYFKKLQLSIFKCISKPVSQSLRPDMWKFRWCGIAKLYNLRLWYKISQAFHDICQLNVWKTFCIYCDQTFQDSSFPRSSTRTTVMFFFQTHLQVCVVHFISRGALLQTSHHLVENTNVCTSRGKETFLVLLRMRAKRWNYL